MSIIGHTQVPVKWYNVNMSDKYRYAIYPERTYVIKIDNDEVEVLGQDIVNIIPDLLRTKYIQACFGYEKVPFDKTEESLVQ